MRNSDLLRRLLWARRKTFEELKEELKDCSGGGSNNWWPWWGEPPTPLNLKYPRENLKLLADKERRKTYAEKLVSGVSEVWERLKEAGITRILDCSISPGG